MTTEPTSPGPGEDADEEARAKSILREVVCKPEGHRYEPASLRCTRCDAVWDWTGTTTGITDPAIIYNYTKIYTQIIAQQFNAKPGDSLSITYTWPPEAVDTTGVLPPGNGQPRVLGIPARARKGRSWIRRKGRSG